MRANKGKMGHKKSFSVPAQSASSTSQGLQQQTGSLRARKISQTPVSPTTSSHAAMVNVGIRWPKPRELVFEPRARDLRVYSSNFAAKLLLNITPAFAAYAASPIVKESAGRIGLSVASLVAVMLGFVLDIVNEKKASREKELRHQKTEMDALSFFHDIHSQIQDPIIKQNFETHSKSAIVQTMAEAAWLIEYTSSEEAQLLNSGFSAVAGGIVGIVAYTAGGGLSGWDAMPLVAIVSISLITPILYRNFRTVTNDEFANPENVQMTMAMSVNAMFQDKPNNDQLKEFRQNEFKFDPQLNRWPDKKFAHYLRTAAPLFTFSAGTVSHIIKNSSHLVGSDGVYFAAMSNYINLGSSLAVMASCFRQYIEIQAKSPFYEKKVRNVRNSLERAILVINNDMKTAKVLNDRLIILKSENQKLEKEKSTLLVDLQILRDQLASKNSVHKLGRP